MSTYDDVGRDFFASPHDASTPAVGEVYGVRSFAVESDTGYLHGLTYKQIWKRADNTAECHMSSDASDRPVWAPAWSVWNSGHNDRYTAAPDHTPGSIGCTCGFYAYWTGDDGWGTTTRVTAVIAAWGVITAGTRGIRCQYARIVALVTPSSPWVEQVWNEGTPSLCHHAGIQPLTWHRVTERYPDVPVFPSLEAALAEFPPTPLRQAS